MYHVALQYYVIKLRTAGHDNITVNVNIATAISVSLLFLYFDAVSVIYDVNVCYI